MVRFGRECADGNADGVVSNFVNSGRYSHLSREDAIELLERRAADRRLGLVWERDEIEHERALNDDFVALDLISEACVGPAPYRNLLIEGDNFDALRALRLSYARQVKCIYIDPPYNTGENDFLYNDRFVSKENAYRHSTWLEFMYRRLELARDLLSDDGVMFISIDDNEAPRLQLLMDQVMPGSYVCSFVWRRRSGSNDSTGRFATVDHEYVLCFGGRKFSFAGIDRDESSYDNPDGDERGDWVNDNLVKAHTLKQRPDAFYPIFNPATDTWYAPDPDNVWRFATRARAAGKKLRAKPMEQLVEEKRILWPKNEEAVVYCSAAELQTAIADGTAPKKPPSLRRFGPPPGRSRIGRRETSCTRSHRATRRLDRAANWDREAQIQKVSRRPKVQTKANLHMGRASCNEGRRSGCPESRRGAGAN